MAIKVKAKRVTNLKHPWVLIDSNTGKIIDDAQGYGYRSPQKAHACYAYRHRTPQQAKKHKKNQQNAKIWWKKHKSDWQTLDQFAFEIAKGSWGPDDTFDYQLFKDYLNENNIDLENNDPRTLWAYYTKH